MPTYEYICENCNSQFEVRQNISDPALSACPDCKEDKLKRGIGGGCATFRFVGDGFYINDYKKEGTKSKCSDCCPCADQ